MSKTVAVLQSNYIPWKGYFDIIHDVDLFIFYDEVQYTKNDWRNRNKVYSPQGLSWITLPVNYDLSKSILEVTLKNNIPWQQQHWDKLHNAYHKAPFFEKYESFLREIYFSREWESLSELNRYLIVEISRRFLGIETIFADSTEFASVGQRQEKLVSLLQSAGCERYISGPRAKAYIEPERFEQAGIELIWKEYSGYPEYEQQKEPFEHSVTVLDLLFHKGDEAPYYIWGYRE